MRVLPPTCACASGSRGRRSPAARAGRSSSETARRRRRRRAELTAEDRLSVVETRHGLAVDSTSHVGRVRLGDVTITVRPKLHGLPLWNLMRFAFDLRALHRYDDAAYEAEPEAFQDVVIARLVDEATQLIARGLHRTYRRARRRSRARAGASTSSRSPARPRRRPRSRVATTCARRTAWSIRCCAPAWRSARASPPTPNSASCRRLEAQLGETVGCRPGSRHLHAACRRTEPPDPRLPPRPGARASARRLVRHRPRSRGGGRLAARLPLRHEPLLPALSRASSMTRSPATL